MAGHPRRAIRHAAALLLDGTAHSDGTGLQLRGLEHQPLGSEVLEEQTPLGVAARGLLGLARLAEEVAEVLRDHPDPEVRRAVAIAAASAHPLRVAFERD